MGEERNVNKDRDAGAVQADESTDMSLEEAFEKLDEVMKALESRDISLEDAFTKYQEGMELIRSCSGKIDRVEKKILMISGDGELHEF